MIAVLNIFSILYDELIRFLGIGALIDMYKSGDYSSLHSLQGIQGAIGPLFRFCFLLKLSGLRFLKDFA